MPPSSVGFSQPFTLVLDRTPLDAQISHLTTKVDELRQFKKYILDTRVGDRMLHHHPRRLSGEYAVTTSHEIPADETLVCRIVDAYKKAIRTPTGSTDSMWLTVFASANKQTHEILEHGSLKDIIAMLRNPASSMLFYGFDSLQSKDSTNNDSTVWLSWIHQLAYDSLLQMCRALGIKRVENPESGIDFQESPSVEELLTELDKVMGFKIDFPNPFDGEVGIKTSRGIANYRAIQALFQAWRIGHLTEYRSRARVLEIGAGLGRTAYYAIKMGIAQYTVIDIPLTGVAQAYYLGRILGDQTISLWGESSDGKVRILPPTAYQKMNERFDLIVNVDSLTEMAPDTAAEYLTGAARMTRQFLSINHEHNPFTVESIYQKMPSVKAWRSPYWLRRGYVEELITFD
ncbi:hypothetical protein HDG34_007914 [Paraburkholderia sp. HC6.4b]|uniref:putative sugar O-methyltransferase n=1 Tax=unclassified Paraburkholderia TaxID=2615204 RepID=UPI0016220EA3|nr:MULTISPECIES: putative sugar O-methyltransferase [unclassified Paraburkholderia]MBB5413931.1 hypothetical protein [Paraburkholderia sp. HC6.4b]MBB5456327.1 hypothetical protein [Paraburkholderia sp. Kb1A]